MVGTISNRARPGLVVGSVLGMLVLGTSLGVGCLEPPVTAVAAPTVTREKHLGVTGAGSSLERLTSDPVTETHPTISPDGRTLLFEVKVFESETSDAIKQQTLVAIDPNTRGQRTLFTSNNSLASEPVWLPDQSSYVYSSNSPGAWSLVRALTASPNAAVNVIASGEIAPEASWPTMSPDGKRVAFTTNLRGVATLAVVGLDGSRFTLLGEGLEPAWSPDGQKLVFRRTVNGFNHLFTLNAETGTDLVQITSGDFNHYTPSWSPDGKYMVFSTDRTAQKTSNAPKVRNLYIIQADGTGLTQLTDGDAITTNPSWGKDGWVYFASNQSGNSDIWRLRPAGEYANLAAVARVAPPEARPPADNGKPSGKKPEAAPSQPSVASPPVVSQPAQAPGCSKDTDCKGARVCEHGACVNPTK